MRAVKRSLTDLGRQVRRPSMLEVGESTEQFLLRMLLFRAAAGLHGCRQFLKTVAIEFKLEG